MTTTKTRADLASELDTLIAKATQESLTDGGRYFQESCDDLTRCRHEEIGEYQNSADGELIEWLWNHRRDIHALLAPSLPQPSLAMRFRRRMESSVTVAGWDGLAEFSDGLKTAIAFSREPIAGDGVGRELDKWSLVILSAVRNDAPSDYDAIVDLIKANQAALAHPRSPLDREAIALVIAARQFWDTKNDGSDESVRLDRALEKFAAVVPYDGTPDILLESTNGGGAPDEPIVGKEVSQEAIWGQYTHDLSAMTDKEIEREYERSLTIIEEEENWVAAIAAWRQDGCPRTVADLPKDEKQ